MFETGNNTRIRTIKDLTKGLIYAFDDFDAGAKGVPIGGYFLAAEVNGMGKKKGDLTQREY